MSDIVFEEPPTGRHAGGRPSKHAKIVPVLQERPGEWARIHVARTRSSADSIAHQIKTGIIKAYNPPGAFDAKARTVDGQFRVYARYVGTGGESA